MFLVAGLRVGYAGGCNYFYRKTLQQPASAVSSDAEGRRSGRRFGDGRASLKRQGSVAQETGGNVAQETGERRSYIL